MDTSDEQKQAAEEAARTAVREDSVDDATVPTTPATPIEQAQAAEQEKDPDPDADAQASDGVHREDDSE